MTQAMSYNFTLLEDRTYKKHLLVLSGDIAHFNYCQKKNDGVSMATSVLGKGDIKSILYKVLWSIKAYTGLRVCRPVIWVS